MGGGVQTPSPQQAVENPEAQQGAGLNKHKYHRKDLGVAS